MKRKRITHEERLELRAKAFWRVRDFARYTGMSHQQARRVLVRYDSELGGMLLRRSQGTNRLFGFYWAALARHDGNAFVDDPLETERRVEKLENDVQSLDERMHGIGYQTAQNTNDIRKIRLPRIRAA